MQIIQIKVDDLGRIPESEVEDVQKILVAVRETIKQDKEFRKNVKNCPLCNSGIRDYKITPTQQSVKLLGDAFRIFKSAGMGEALFTKLDIGAGSDTNFSKLIQFGLLYRRKDEDGKKMRGCYGMNRRYVAEFFARKRSIPAFIWVNGVSGKKQRSEERVLVDEIANVKDIMQDFGDIMTEYRMSEPMPVIEDQLSLNI